MSIPQNYLKQTFWKKIVQILGDEGMKKGAGGGQSVPQAPVIMIFKFF